MIAFTIVARLAMLWLPAEIARMLHELLGVPVRAIRDDVPQHPEIWDDICVRHHLPGRLIDVRTRSLVGAGAQVFVRRARLQLRALTPVPTLYRGFALQPDDENDPYAFRIDLLASGWAVTASCSAGNLEPERRPSTSTCSRCR